MPIRSQLLFPAARQQQSVNATKIDPEVCFGTQGVTMCTGEDRGPTRIITGSLNSVTCPVCRQLLDVAWANGGVLALREIAKKALGF